MSDLPDLTAAGLRLLETGAAPELFAVIEANREYLSRWLPWAAGQTLGETEQFIASAREQLAADNGFQAAVAPARGIVGVTGFHGVSWENERLGFRQEAILREAERIGDHYLDTVVYGVLEDERRDRRGTPRKET